MFSGLSLFPAANKTQRDVRDCCEKCLSGAHDLGLKAPTQSLTRNRISGCIHTITDSFSCRSEKVSGAVRQLIRYVTFHLRDRRDTASLVIETAPKSLFLCANRSPVRYGFCAGANSVRYSVIIA